MQTVRGVSRTFTTADRYGVKIEQEHALVLRIATMTYTHTHSKQPLHNLHNIASLDCKVNHSMGIFTILCRLVSGDIALLPCDPEVRLVFAQTDTK